eukprot:CAMPEP_0204641500 /NCGR_PEP_ID=MMETSP0717-20131115/51162_1 /ASSEMBLY_ACC=CAM_ASM_000666 /TAXON_ID=230516 /ORGANISM="Chaetoceros curvisetus" /LENGTH=516 /DNA_ID=CAMNT_0051662171 /DNA_START=473 /DNA_END=2023 /DNA_ORIENTATION=+
MQGELDTVIEEVMERKRKKVLQDLHTCKLKSLYEKADLDLLGVSVHHLLLYFMKEVHRVGLTENSKFEDLAHSENLLESDGFRQKCANITCPIDGRSGASYVHSIVFGENDDENDKDHYGKATVMLSYSCHYPIRDIVLTLTDFCKLSGLDPKRTYVWIYFLCVNQHRVLEIEECGKNMPPPHTLEVIYRRRVKGIGHLLPMMSPCRDSGCLGRTWCLFEIIMAKKYGCQITMIMLGSHKHDFLQMFEAGKMDRSSRFFEVLLNTRVQDAKSCDESDRVIIMKVIEDMPGGYTTFNAQVNELVRSWAIDIIKNEVNTRRDLVSSGALSQDHFASFLSRVGNVLKEVGETRDALQMHKESVTIFESLHGRNRMDTTKSMNNMACVMYQLDQKEEALQLYGKILTLQKSLFGKNHVSTVMTMSNMAGVMNELGQNVEALRLCREVLRIKESLFGKKHVSTAHTMFTMANSLYAHNRRQKALETYKEALSVYETMFGPEYRWAVKAKRRISTITKELKK